MRKVKLRRLVAIIIDLSIILLLAAAIAESFCAIGVLEDIWFATIFSSLFFGMMFFKDLTFRNQSIGKKLCGICIVNNRTGAKPSKLALVLRNTSWPFFYLFNLFWIFINNRTIGDMLCNTRIERVEKSQKS